MTDVNLQRRALLATGAAAALLLPTPPASAKDGALQSVKSLFRHRRDAAAIGVDYLRRHPDEADGENLLSRVFGEDLASVRHAAARGDQSTIDAKIASSITADLRAARIHTYEGWVMARAEARLCAILSLTMRQVS